MYRAGVTSGLVPAPYLLFSVVRLFQLLPKISKPKINSEPADISDLDPSTITINATTIVTMIKISHVFSLTINHACLRIHIKRRTIDNRQTI